MLDVLIRNGKVVDGSGNPWFYGDVAIEGDRVVDITPVGRISEDQVGEVVDAEGRVVCPGFIDIQSHAITSMMSDGRCLSKITQGITTEVMGETSTPAPYGGKGGGLPGEWKERAKGWSRFGDWLDAVVDEGVSAFSSSAGAASNANCRWRPSRWMKCWETGTCEHASTGCNRIALSAAGHSYPGSGSDPKARRCAVCSLYRPGSPA